MTTKNKALLANSTQAALWIGSLSQLYVASKSDQGVSAMVGFGTWVIYILVFMSFFYMARNNSKAGVVLLKNFKNVKEFKARKKAGEKSDTLEGDEFIRNINYKAAYMSMRIITAFMISLWLFSFLLISKNTNGDSVYLLDQVKASTLLWVSFAFIGLTGIIQLFKASPSNTD